MPDPAVIAVQMLAKSLPGFESRISPSGNTLQIRGALPINAEVSTEVVTIPVYSLSYTTNEEEIQEILSPLINDLVTSIQDRAISAVGLAPRISDIEDRAHSQGVSEGYRSGVVAGRAETVSWLVEKLATMMKED